MTVGRLEQFNSRLTPFDEIRVAECSMDNPAVYPLHCILLQIEKMDDTGNPFLEEMFFDAVFSLRCSVSGQRQRQIDNDCWTETWIKIPGEPQLSLDAIPWSCSITNLLASYFSRDKPIISVVWVDQRE